MFGGIEADFLVVVLDILGPSHVTKVIREKGLSLSLASYALVLNSCHIIPDSQGGRILHRKRFVEYRYQVQQVLDVKIDHA